VLTNLTVNAVECRLEQEKMKQELVALQRLLESKERRMAELQTAGEGIGNCC
jgi:hypothetical protein